MIMKLMNKIFNFLDYHKYFILQLPRFQKLICLSSSGHVTYLSNCLTAEEGGYSNKLEVLR